MSKELVRYQKLLKRLHDLRKKNKGKESEEEDNILEEMDTVWFEMSDKDRETLDA